MIPEHLKNYYTEEGIATFINRMNNFIEVYNAGRFPFNEACCGFPRVVMQDKEECRARIIELCELTASEVSFDEQEVTYTNGMVGKIKLCRLIKRGDFDGARCLA